MTREEAAKVLDEMIGRLLATMTTKHFTQKSLERDRDYIDALKAGKSALRGPVPDPETGLVPCGCGGRPFINSGSIHCPKCGIQVRCGHDRYIDHHDSNRLDKEIREPWNTAMGYKEDA